MSLEFWTDDVRNQDRLFTDETKQNWSPWVQCMTFTCMGIGMGSITDDNKDEWYGRAKVIEALNGCIIASDGGKPVPITPQDVEDFVGLKTNATTETRRQWAQRNFIGGKPDVSFTNEFARSFRMDRDRASKSAV